MTDELVTASRLVLVVVSFLGVVWFAARGRLVAIFHACTFLALLGFAVFGFEGPHAWAYSVGANLGSAGIIALTLRRDIWGHF